MLVKIWIVAVRDECKFRLQTRWIGRLKIMQQFRSVEDDPIGMMDARSFQATLDLHANPTGTVTPTCSRPRIAEIDNGWQSGTHFQQYCRQVCTVRRSR